MSAGQIVQDNGDGTVMVLNAAGQQVRVNKSALSQSNPNPRAMGPIAPASAIPPQGSRGVAGGAPSAPQAPETGDPYGEAAGSVPFRGTAAPEAPEATAETDFVDPQGGGPSPAMAQLQAIQSLPPGAIVPGTARGGRMVAAQGPTQRQFQELGPGEVEGFEGQVNAILQQAELDALAAKRNVHAAQLAAGVELEKADIATQAVAEAQDREQRRQKAVATELAKLDGLREKIQSTEIDPDRWWGDKSTGGKITSAIGILIGGIAQGLDGRENVALRMIDKAIERDIDAQKAGLTRDIQAASIQEGIVAQTRQMYADEAVADASAKQGMLQAADQQMAALQAQAKIPSDQEAIGRVRAGVQQQIGALQQEMGRSLRSTVGTSTQVRAVGGSKGLTREQALEQLRKTTGSEEYDRERFVPGYDANARSPEEAKGYRKAAEVNRSLKSDIARLEKFQSQGSKISKEDRNAADSLAQNLTVKLAVLYELGAISSDDKDIVEGIGTGGENPLSFINLQGGRLRELKGVIDRSEAAITENLVPVDFVPEAYR